MAVVYIVTNQDIENVVWSLKDTVAIWKKHHNTGEGNIQLILRLGESCDQRGKNRLGHEFSIDDILTVLSSFGKSPEEFLKKIPIKED